MTFPCLVSRQNLDQQLFYRLLHKKKENPCAACRKVSFLDATLPVCPSLKLMYLRSRCAVVSAALSERKAAGSIPTIGDFHTVDPCKKAVLACLATDVK